MVEFQKKRWKSLLAGIIINLLAGVAYAWSVFVLPLNARYGWSISELAMAYTLMSVTLMFSNMTVVPFFRKRLPLSKVLLIGGLLYGGGVAVSGYVSIIYLFYITFSLVVGIGNTLIYPVLMTYSQQIYPEKPGFSSGMMAAGYGFGAVVWATVASELYSGTEDIAVVMLILGVFFLVGIVITSLFVKEVPDGFASYIKEATASKEDNQVTEPKQEVYLYEKPRKEMLKDPLFPIVYVCMIIGSICGNMIITQGSPIMQKDFGVAPETAALLVSLFSLGNTLGRPVWGKISDKIGRIRSFVLLHSFMAIAMATLFVCKIEVIFIGALCLVMLCYGGIATLIAPMTADFWGAKYITENYGITFSIFGMSTLVGAPLIAGILENTGSYSLAYVAGLALSIMGLVSALILLKKVAKIKKAA